MGAGEYAAGVAFAAVTFGGCGVAAALALRRLSYRGALRPLAAAVLFTVALIFVHMLPGVLGVLSRWTAATTALFTASGMWLLVSRRSGATPVSAAGSEEASRAGPPAVRALAALSSAAIAVAVVGYFRVEATRSVISDDMLNFHLPLVASWIRSGTLWPVVDLLPYDTTGNYPQNGDVLMLATVLPWRFDAFARLAALPYIGLAGLATYALGLELRADRAHAGLLACVVTATPILLLAGVVSGLPDVVMYGTFGAGLVFLVRAGRTCSSRDAALAGIGLGIAFGTKWYAVPAVAVTLMLFGARLAVERVDRRAVARLLGVAGGLTALAGGFWLVRNAIESGSPFFPAGWLPIGARSDLGNPAPRTDFPIAHYLLDGRVWHDVILPDEWHAFGVAGLLLLAAGALAALLAIRAARLGERGARDVLWLLAVAVTLAAVYVLTPNTASGPDGHPVLVYYSARYLVPAAIPAAAAVAWAASRLPRAGLVIDVVAVIAVGDGLGRAFDLSAGRLAAGLAAVLVLAGALWVSRRSLAAATAAAAILLVAGGYALEHSYARQRLRGQDAAVDYFLSHARDDERVALAEQWSVQPPAPVLAMFGDRLRGRVSYAGEQAGGVNKPYRDPARFAARVTRDRYAWLLVGRGPRPPAITPAMRWAPANGYELVAQSERLALYRRAQTQPGAGGG